MALRSSSELVLIVQRNEAIIQERAQILGCKSPSIVEGWEPVLEKDKAAIKAQNEILNATHELNAIVRGASQTLMTPAMNMWASLHSILRLDLVSAIPLNEKDEGVSFEDIAVNTQLPVDTIKRLFRHAATLFIFREEPKGMVRHTAASRYLAGNYQLQRAVDMMLSENWPCSVHLAEALVKWPQGVEHNQTAYQIAHNTDLDVFAFFATRPERRKRFIDAMSWYTQSPSFGMIHLINGYSWDRLSNGKVVDIGGSAGKVCLALSSKYPNIKFVVQDLPEVIAKAQESVNDKSSNVEFMAHDFFTKQPVADADVYLFRQIMHDWSDHYVKQILTNVASVMTKDAVILINERLLPDYKEAGYYSEQLVRSADLIMLSNLNGKERNREDFENVFAATKPRLQISRIITPEGSTSTIIEARLHKI